MFDLWTHLPRTLTEFTKIFSGFKVEINIPKMEQFVHKQAYLSCAIVDLFSGWSTIFAFERVLDGISCVEVGGGEYGII